MTDSTTLRRFALALALLAAFVGGILTERAFAEDDAAYWHHQCEVLSDALACYIDLD